MALTDMQASRLGGFDRPPNPESVMPGDSEQYGCLAKDFTRKEAGESQRRHSTAAVHTDRRDVVLVVSASLCVIQNRDAASCARSSKKNGALKIRTLDIDQAAKREVVVVGPEDVGDW